MLSKQQIAALKQFGFRRKKIVDIIAPQDVIYYYEKSIRHYIMGKILITICNNYITIETGKHPVWCNQISLTSTNFKKFIYQLQKLL